MAQDLNGVPAGAEVWQNTDTGQYFLAYYSPGDRIPLIYEFSEGQSTINALYGQGQSIQVDRHFTSDQINATGAVPAGSTDDVTGTDSDPFRRLVENFEERVKVEPWLNDPEILALTTEAILEGRDPEDWEIQNTTWFQSRTDREREWFKLSAGDPATAEQRINDNRQAVRGMLMDAGIANPDNFLINTIADNITTGRWTEQYASRQARLLSDPFAPGVLDQQLRRFEGGVDTTQKGEEQVRERVRQWLGPYGNYDEAAISRWAGILRNDPDGEQKLTEHLRSQKKGLFPEYDEDATWQDISQPWKGFISREWGTQVQDDNPVLHRVVKLNDAADASDYLRREGLKRGVEQVVENAVGSATSQFGGVIPTGA